MAIPAGIIVAWITSASIPSGWSRVTDMDDRFSKATTGSPAPDATGGTATHVHDSASHTHSAAHTHTGTTGASDSNLHGCPGNCIYSSMLCNHTHTYTIGSAGGTSGGADHGDWSAGSSDPAYYTVRWIESNGSPAGVPDDGLVFWNDADEPTGWRHHPSSKDKFLIGAADGENGDETGGGGTHTHTPGAHTHSAGDHTHGSGGSSSHTDAGGAAFGEYYGGTLARSGHGVNSHDHVVTAFSDSGSVTSGAFIGGTSGTTTYEPEYHTLMAIDNTSGGDSLSAGMIVGWLGTIGNIPDDWVLCDGNNDTPNLNGKFIKAADSEGDIGDEGGAAGHQNSSGGHTHSTSHNHAGGATDSHTSNMAGEAGTTTSNPGCQGPDTNHQHVASTSATDGSLVSDSPTLSNTADTQPAHRTMAWLQFQGSGAAGSAAMFGANF